METEIIVGFFIALVVMGLSLFTIKRTTFFPGVQLQSGEVRCPDFPPEIDEDNFNYYLRAAQSGCVFNATMKSHLPDEFLEEQAKIAGFVDKQRDPVILRNDDCSIPFKALVICNGTLFPGDLVEFSAGEGVIIRKLGR